MLVYIYMLLTLAMGISALWKGAVYPGIAGIVGPTLCWFAASGLKGSLMVGTWSQKLAGLGLGIAFVAAAVGIVYHAGYRVGLFDLEFTGVTWCLVGLVAGWMSTTRAMATTGAAGNGIDGTVKHRPHPALGRVLQVIAVAWGGVLVFWFLFDAYTTQSRV